MKTKCFINRCFNIDWQIITIRGTNMNFGILQYKNCQKQRHTTFTYCSHSSKCQKCNSLYKIKHHREMVQYYKANFKIFLLNLKLRKKNLILIHLSILIAKANTRQILLVVHFGSIDLTRSSTLRSLKSFKKSKLT